MTTTAKVSVVIPIKGRPQLFELTAQSLVKQNYSHWEAIVVDDGSSASEYKRIAEIAGCDQRIRMIKNPGPRHGASACRNAGLAASCGEYIVFLDGDDALAPTCLQRRVEVMKSNPKIDFAVFPTSLFRTYPEIPDSSGTSSRRRMILTGFFVPTCRGIRLARFGKKTASSKKVRGMIAFSPRKTGSFMFVPSRQG
jgi:glycosyltransferase involved in cell wall biosynthesis